MSVLGIELGVRTIRAVLRTARGEERRWELPWTPAAPAPAIEQLRAEAGSVRRVGVAVGLAHLTVQRVTLPPAPAAVQRQMLRVEPDRWFPLATEGELAVGLTPDGTLAFACDGALMEQWWEALTSLSAQVTMEPAPVALARTVADGGWRWLEDEQGWGRVEVRDGVLVSLRRGQADAERGQVATPDPYAVARGAALTPAPDDPSALRTARMDAEAAASRRRQVLLWGAAATASLLLAVWSLGQARTRTLAALEAALGPARAAAETGRASLDRAFALDREAEAITTLRATRPDAARALSLVSARLPRSAVAQRVRVEGREWQVEGNAVTAAAVLESLAAEPQFEKVRFLAPSTRYQEPTGSRETYSIGFILR